MAIEEIIMFRSSDGKLHNNQLDAEQHEDFIRFQGELEASSIRWWDTSAEEVADWLWDNYDIKPRY